MRDTVPAFLTGMTISDLPTSVTSGGMGGITWEDVSVAERREMRTFGTGATRDANADKHDYSGFNSPLVEKRFGEYMHLHRKQADGSMRGSSNWKQGIPVDAYKESLHRHFVDLWLHLDGFGNEAVDKDIESVLCAIRFNTNGMLYEIVKQRVQQTS